MTDKAKKPRWGNPPVFPGLPIFLNPPGRDLRFLSRDQVPEWVKRGLNRAMSRPGFRKESESFARRLVEIRNLRATNTLETDAAAADAAYALATRFRRYCISRCIPLVFHDLLWHAMTARPPVSVLDVVPEHFLTNVETDQKTARWPQHVVTGRLGGDPWGRVGKPENLQFDGPDFVFFAFDPVGTRRNEVHAAVDEIVRWKFGPSGRDSERAVNAVDRIEEWLCFGLPPFLKPVAADLVKAWKTFMSTGRRERVLVDALCETVALIHVAPVSEVVAKRALKRWRESELKARQAHDDIPSE